MAIIISRTIHGNNVKNEEKRPDLMANPAVVQTLEQVFGRLEREYESEAAQIAENVGHSERSSEEGQ
ncbi:hypothetical protein AAA088_10275 [Hominifimenecus microfluidus]|uniref:Uncharacterized protein n=1 Tax=Hominifimenecus microfluidus TaxID=2885348 RepID=A0AAE3EB30_9FIRM|nr:hypothetical protein [Hominifimenecus microfluidus]MCC2231225.1 hypothetical protein [Hominifimenecus microfluidus]